MQQRHRQRGFTLIEILVALLVFSIGLLGLAGLQTSSLKFNQTAYQRSQATVVAQSMLDYLRADRDAATDEEYDIALDDDTPSGDSLDFPKRVLKAWRSDIEELLPARSDTEAASGSVDVENDGTVTVEVEWGERDDTDDGYSKRSFVFVSRL